MENKNKKDAVAGATPYAQRMKRQNEREAIETQLSEVEHLIDMREDFLESDEADLQSEETLNKIKKQVAYLNLRKDNLLKKYNELFEQEYGYWDIGDKKSVKDKEKFEYYFEIPVEEEYEVKEYWVDEDDSEDITNSHQSYRDLQTYRGATATEMADLVKKELPEKARVYGEWIDENLYTLDIYTDTYFSDEEIMEIAKKVYNIDTDIDERFYVDDGFVDVYFVTTIKDIVRIKEES